MSLLGYTTQAQVLVNSGITKLLERRSTHPEQGVVHANQQASDKRHPGRSRSSFANTRLFGERLV